MVLKICLNCHENNLDIHLKQGINYYFDFRVESTGFEGGGEAFLNKFCTFLHDGNRSV